MNNEGNTGDGIPQKPPEEGQEHPAQEPHVPPTPPSEERPHATTPEEEAQNIIHLFSQGGGREEAERQLRGKLPDEALDILLGQIPLRDEIPPRQHPEGEESESSPQDGAQEESSQQDSEETISEPEEPGRGDSEAPLSPLAIQLREMSNRVRNGHDSASEALDSLPEELRDRYQKPFEEMEKIATLGAAGQEVPTERIEGIKKAFTDSDMSVEEAENLLIGTNIPDDAKNEIRAKIAEKEEGRVRRDDNDGAMEAVSEAQNRLKEANDMIDGSNDLSEPQKEDFKTKLRALNLKLEDAGVNKLVRGIGKGAAVSIIMVLIFIVWEMQMIGRVSKKSGR